MSPGPDRVPLVFHKSAPLASSVSAGSGRRTRKAFVRRRGDSSQQLRVAVQMTFGAVALAVGVQFYLWVRFFESAGRTVRVARPAGVEAWLPIAALMNLKTLLVTGDIPAVHAAGMFMLIAFLAISFACRKAFCSWICPVGTISEWLWQSASSITGRTLSVPRWLDVPMRGLKYLLLALFLYVVIAMPVPAIHAFLESPYGMVADVKMLDFFRHLGRATAVVLAVLVVLSMAVKNVWCRYLCPYGALMGLAALVSPSRIRRDPVSCIDCGKCAAACPSGLPVDVLLTVRSAECNACMSCVSVCPAVGALDLTIGLGRRRTALPPRLVAAIVVGLFLGVVGVARWTGHWQTTMPDAVYFDLIPRASTFAHPR